MAPFPSWASLPPDLVCRIGDQLDLKAYAGARGACTAWRRALVPQSPTLLVFGADKDGHWWRPYAASVTTWRSLELTAIASGARCVGSSNDGWLAFSVVHSFCRCHTFIVLVNPVAALEFPLPPLIYDSRWTKVSKVVFTPIPAKDDFAAAAICDGHRVAYVTAGATRWAVMNPVRLASGDHFVDVVYTGEGNKVYCLTKCGDAHVLRLPERRRRKPADVDEAAGPSEPNFSLLRHPQRPFAWPGHPRKFQKMHYERQARTRDQDPIIPIILYDDKGTNMPSVPPDSLEPDLNLPATVEPLLSKANLPFNPATILGPPHDIVLPFTSAKNLVFCMGNLYQVWRNDSCTVRLKLPAGGRHRLGEHEVLVLRYYPERQPCWDVVKDLGGHSFFVGRNNAVSMYAKGVPGLRGNCVYWIGGRGRDQGMVFDMESGRSTPCSAPPPPVGFLPGHPHSTICWYFLSDACNEHQQQLQQ